ncbi:hypothetical protein [Gynuella sp.]|uniref:hypothetical protein n=1 Tax=Gynuella sp. TaxID=2969146 RepID=UPI003D0BFAFE
MHNLKKKIRRAHVMTRLEDISQAQLQQALHQIEHLRSVEQDKKAAYESEIESLHQLLGRQTRAGHSFDPTSYLQATRVISDLEQHVHHHTAEIDTLSQQIHGLSEQLQQVSARKKTLQRLGERLHKEKHHQQTGAHYKQQDEAILHNYRGRL